MHTRRGSENDGWMHSIRQGVRGYMLFSSSANEFEEWNGKRDLWIACRNLRSKWKGVWLTPNRTLSGMLKGL